MSSTCEKFTPPNLKELLNFFYEICIHRFKLLIFVFNSRNLCVFSTEKFRERSEPRGEQRIFQRDEGTECSISRGVTLYSGSWSVLPSGSRYRPGTGAAGRRRGGSGPTASVLAAAIVLCMTNDCYTLSIAPKNDRVSAESVHFRTIGF